MPSARARVAPVTTRPATVPTKPHPSGPEDPSEGASLMGYILYRNRTNPSGTDQGMWDNPLNTYLREHQMGRAGTIYALPEMIHHVEAIAAMWWQYTNPAQATLGAIRFINGGIVGPSLTPLIDTPEQFTTVAAEGLRSWHTLLAADPRRRDLYGRSRRPAAPRLQLRRIPLRPGGHPLRFRRHAARRARRDCRRHASRATGAPATGWGDGDRLACGRCGADCHTPATTWGIAASPAPDS